MEEDGVGVWGAGCAWSTMALSEGGVKRVTTESRMHGMMMTKEGMLKAYSSACRPALVVRMRTGRGIVRRHGPHGSIRCLP
jgi:hypothetical protein